MKIRTRALKLSGLCFAALGLAVACGYDASLREYLSAYFWLPFSKNPSSFARSNVRRVDAPFAGMTKASGDTPLEKLRAAYQQIPQPQPYGPPPSIDAAPLRTALAAAQADTSLSRRDREEVELLDAKIDMRLAEAQGGAGELLKTALTKLQAFLKSARTPEFRSEARGWLAHIYFVTGNQTAAGKIYLDELNRNGSNLSEQTLLDSLQMTYGYDGGASLIEHLAEYFDTPEHAAFAIQLVTNPHADPDDDKLNRPDKAQIYARIRSLLDRHADLLNSNRGSHALALLGMRTALRMGDPPGALDVAAMVPADAQIRNEPDFQWMLASAHFLSHDFAGAEAPLLDLFASKRATGMQHAAAAYGLCGVYEKTGNVVEQVRFALWLYSNSHLGHGWVDPGDFADQTIYWAPSGWDLGLLLDDEASDEQLETFLQQYPDVPNARLVRYSLAVRAARENRYADAARIYESIHASWRVPRMRQLAALYQETTRTDLPPAQLHEAQFRFAQFLSQNSTKIYFNDQLWSGLQRYALTAETDDRLTKQERAAGIARERRLKDDQEEYWRAYLILRDVVHDEGKTALARQSAQLALTCLRRINTDRFGREDEIRAADIDLSKWLRQ